MRMKIKKKLSSSQMILLGFANVILLGTFLLMLPISSKSREFTPFLDSFFTSTSAVCVTGLVVYDTATHWSLFGQIVILLLIQIGGMGVVVAASSLVIIAGKKIGLSGRDTIKESLSAPTLGGIVRLTGFILKGIFIFELLGAILMMPVFCKDFHAKGIWLSIFHSVSGFCNAGFDLMGSQGEFSSLTYYSSNVLINLVIMGLIIVGGIGFLVWEDIYEKKWRIKKYRMQSKMILLITAILIFLPALYFFFFEFNDFPIGKRILLSLFQSITTRTAGFNSAELSSISETGDAIMILLMLIGASPGSTAGGMKTTTILVLFASSFAVFKQKENAELAQRRIDDSTIKNAVAIFLLYIVLFFVGGILISLIEKLPILSCLFETASAIGTVGLSLGITSSLSPISKLILMALMFFGRVGGLTLIYAAVGSPKKQNSKLPLEKITVG